MRRVPSVVWAGLVFALLHLLFTYGVAPLAEALTGTPAPLPSSLVLMYSGLTAVAILLFLSVREDRWRNFIDPVAEFLRNPAPASRTRRVLRRAVLLLTPVLVGGWAYARASGAPEPPADPPGIHFDLPEKYLALENPLPWTPENIRAGGILYTKHCAMCHGDAQEGDGPFARALQPKPASFRDPGTIAQLAESYLYWRIKEGGPGVPKGSIEYRSAMPVWDGVLTDEQIWKIIMFEYTNAGQMPARRE